jgi:DNA repair exonuclease SbcCD ATPase subunit
MLVLKTLTFSAIGRFVDKQVIDFTGLDSINQVEGQNNNTGGSSGSGKSTAFKALDFLLGLNDISNGVLQSRLTKETMTVEGLFDFDGQPLRIERGKKLLIDLNGEITTGSSKTSEEKLDQIIGMPRDLFRKILHKRQGEGGFFLDMGPSDIHKFLTSCLGLEKEQSKNPLLDSKLTTLTSIESSVQTSIQSNSSGLEATSSAILGLGEFPSSTVTPEAIEALKNGYHKAVETHKILKVNHQNEMENLEKYRPILAFTPFDRSEIEKTEKSICELNEKKNKINKIESERQVLISKKISELKSQIDNLCNQEILRQSEVKSAISLVQTEIASLKQKEQNRQVQVQSTLSTNKFEQLKLKSVISSGDQSKEDASRFMAELNKVRASICPTCEQGWIAEASKTKELDLLKKLQDCKKLVISGMEASAKLEELEKEINSLQSELCPKPIPELESLSTKIIELTELFNPRAIPEVTPIKAQINQLNLELSPAHYPELVEMESELTLKVTQVDNLRSQEKEHQFKESAKNKLLLDNFNLRQTEVRQKNEHILKIAQEAENRALLDHESAKAKIKFFEESKSRYEDALLKLSEQKNKYKEQLDQKSKELDLILEEKDLILESKKVIKSYLSCSFEDALDSIGDEATKMIRGIPNMGTATVQFEGLKETKEGKVKEEVTCMISMDGEIGIPVKSLSGGERSSVDIGIDLSVIKFIEESTGKGINIMILDEFTGGLDTVCIENAIEMLKNSSIDKKLLLVEHNPVVSQSIENKILVVRDGLTSKIVQ